MTNSEDQSNGRATNYRLMQEIYGLKTDIEIIKDRIVTIDVKELHRRLSLLEQETAPVIRDYQQKRAQSLEMTTGLKMALAGAILFMIFTAIVGPLILRAMGFH